MLLPTCLKEWRGLHGESCDLPWRDAFALKQEARVLDIDLILLPPSYLLPLLPFGQIRCQNTVDPEIPVRQLFHGPPGLRAGGPEEGGSRGTAARGTQHSELLVMQHIFIEHLLCAKHRCKHSETKLTYN